MENYIFLVIYLFYNSVNDKISFIILKDAGFDTLIGVELCLKWIAELYFVRKVIFYIKEYFLYQTVQTPTNHIFSMAFKCFKFIEYL